VFPGRLPCQHEDACADDGADAEHGQVEGTECAFEAASAMAAFRGIGVACVGDEHANRANGLGDRFGQSGKPQQLMELFGLTAENLVIKAEEVLKQKKALRGQ